MVLDFRWRRRSLSLPTRVPCLGDTHLALLSCLAPRLLNQGGLDTEEPLPGALLPAAFAFA